MNERSSAQVQWTVLPGLPGTGNILQFNREDQVAFREGFILQFTKHEQAWIGNFQKGDGHYCYVLLLPEENAILVVAGGLGYKVPIDSPKNYTILGAYPITYVSLLRDTELLILATYTDFYAYRSSGLVWHTDRLAVDDLEVINISQKYLAGRGWNPSIGGRFEFRLELETGHYEITS